jgi:hypothetical protein
MSVLIHQNCRFYKEKEDVNIMRKSRSKLSLLSFREGKLNYHDLAIKNPLKKNRF